MPSAFDFAVSPLMMFLRNSVNNHRGRRRWQAAQVSAMYIPVRPEVVGAMGSVELSGEGSMRMRLFHIVRKLKMTMVAIDYLASGSDMGETCQVGKCQSAASSNSVGTAWNALLRMRIETGNAKPT